MIVKRPFLLLLFCCAASFFIVPGTPVLAESIQTSDRSLSDVPFFVRREFFDQTGKSWKEATPNERREFLGTWSGSAQSSEPTQEELKEAKRKALETKKEAQDLKREKERAITEAKKRKIEEERERKRKLQELKKAREEAIKELRRKQQSRRR